jgi:hypothetical protein
VNYLAVSSNNWITHGTLTTIMGLTANLLYGFRTPSGKQFITAGNAEAVISEKYVHNGLWFVDTLISLISMQAASYCSSLFTAWHAAAIANTL